MAIENRRTFNQVAELYDAVRPRYADRLFRDLITLTRLRPAARILEVGAGTGIATLPLAERGCHITMNQAERQYLYDEIRRRISRRSDPKVRRHWLAILHVARPVATA